MRKILAYAAMLTLLLSLTACGNRSTTPSQDDETPPAEPENPTSSIQLDTLSVELSRNGLSGQQLMQAARELPEQLQAHLKEAGVSVGEVTVSVGTSTAATAQALSEGTIDLAFLPAEDLLEFGTHVTPLLADAPEPALTPGGETASSWNTVQSVDAEAQRPAGIRTLICAGSSSYGVQLSGRETPTWTELSRAHWGVLQEDSISGYQAFDLWLSDQYEGNQITDLPDVTVYDSYEELFQAAAFEEIDAFPIYADARLDASDVGGLPGLHTTSTVWEEVRVIGVTDPLLSMTAAVSQQKAQLTAPEFQTALYQAVQSLDDSQRETLGASSFAPIEPDALNPLRRLMTMNGTEVLLERAEQES